MATTQDSTAALAIFQRDLDRIPLTRSPTDPDLFLHLDQIGDHVRFAFARLQNRTVTALAVFFAADPADGVLSFQGFYAVPEAYRNQGRAKDILRAALRHMEDGFARTEVDAVRLDVFVEAANIAAQHVAAAVISPNPEPVTDQASGLPALLYGATLKKRTAVH